MMKVLAIIPQGDGASSMIFAKRQIVEMGEFGAEVVPFYLVTRLSFSLLGEVKRLWGMICRERPAVIHAHYGTITGLVASLFFWKIPVVITFRGSDLNIDPGVSFPRRYIGPLLSQLSCLLAKKTICVSSGLRSQILFNRWRSVVIPDGVDLEKFVPMDRDECRKKLGMGSENPLVVFNCSKQPVTKGLSFAEEVIAVVKKDFPDLIFKTFVGDTDPEEIPLYLNAADCTLMVSLSEGSPVIVKEALAVNLPILASQVGDVDFMLKDVKYSFVLPREVGYFTSLLREILKKRVRSDGRGFSERYDAKVKTEEVVGCLRLVGLDIG